MYRLQWIFVYKNRTCIIFYEDLFSVCYMLFFLKNQHNKCERRIIILFAFLVFSMLLKVILLSNNIIFLITPCNVYEECRYSVTLATPVGCYLNNNNVQLEMFYIMCETPSSLHLVNAYSG